MQDRTPFSGRDGHFSADGVPADARRQRFVEPLQLAVLLVTEFGASPTEQTLPVASPFSEAATQRIWRCVRAATTEWQLLLRRGSQLADAAGQPSRSDTPSPVSSPETPPASASPDLIRTTPARPVLFRELVSVMADVFAVDPLLNVLAARLQSADQRASSSRSMALVADLLERQSSTRNLAMQEMLAAPPSQLQTIRQLDGFRRQLEVWNDLLLANLPFPFGNATCVYSESRYSDFLHARQKSGPAGLTGEDRSQLNRAAHLLYAGVEIPDGEGTAGYRGLLSAMRDALVGTPEAIDGPSPTDTTQDHSRPVLTGAALADAAWQTVVQNPALSINEQVSPNAESIPRPETSLAWAAFCRIPLADRGSRPLRLPR